MNGWVHMLFCLSYPDSMPCPMRQPCTHATNQRFGEHFAPQVGLSVVYYFLSKACSSAMKKQSETRPAFQMQS